MKEDRYSRALTVGYLIAAVLGQAMAQRSFAAEEAAVLTGTVTGVSGLIIDGEVVAGPDDGKPLAGAVVRAAIPAVDMRNIRTRPEHLRFETKTDADGHYKLLLPVRATNTKVSLDAFAPGYGSFAGSHMMGGAGGAITLNPNSRTSFDFKLGKSLYVAGVVVDSQSKAIAGVEITASCVETNSYGYVTVVLSQEDGKFEIFDFPTSDFKMGAVKSNSFTQSCEPRQLRMFTGFPMPSVNSCVW